MKQNKEIIIRFLNKCIEKKYIDNWNEHDIYLLELFSKEILNKNIENIGIICLNSSDFKNFIINKINLINENIDLIDNKKAILNNKRYIKISNVCDICSFSFDEIIETDNAKENENYNKIIEVSKFNLNYK